MPHVLPDHPLFVPGFKAVIFRRVYPEIVQEGGLWDESMEVYPYVSGDPVQGRLEWRFHGDCSIRFAHMQHEKDRFAFKSAQIPFIGFDQLETFTAKQFWYLLSRSRTVLPIRPYIRATANPEPGWLAELLQWWWDPETGYPIEERSGVIRYFVRVGGEITWGDSPDELRSRFPNLPAQAEPKSFTFIRSTIFDNPILLRQDPDYLSWLYTQDRVDQERLLKGNWLIEEGAGKFFTEASFKIIDPREIPRDALRVRYWDEAATTKETSDFTAGVLMAFADDKFFVEDVVHGRWDTTERDRIMAQTKELDRAIGATRMNPAPNKVIQVHQREPGSSGVDRARAFARLMRGVPFKAEIVTGPKTARADAYSSSAGAGDVYVAAAPWTRAFIREHIRFDDGEFDDQVDAASGAFNILAGLAPDWIAGQTEEDFEVMK